MIITEQHINEAVNGTLNKLQADMLLLNWPISKDWKKKLLGKNWSEEWYQTLWMILKTITKI